MCVKRYVKEGIEMINVPYSFHKRAKSFVTLPAVTLFIFIMKMKSKEKQNY